MSNTHPIVIRTAASWSAYGIILCLLSALAAAQDRSTFYVGGAGASDRNPGTATEPFATIQKAANVARPGDVVKIRDGIYRETVAPANSGTEDNPIVFEADAGAEPVISGADLVTTNWQLASHANLPGVDPVTKPIYETTITLPVDGYLEETLGNTDLAANQVFVRSKMMGEARWPKMTDPDDPMGGTSMAHLPDATYFTSPRDNGYARVLTRAQDWIANVAFGKSSTGPCTVTDAAIPNIPGGWTGGRLKLLTGFIPCDNLITASGTGSVTWVPREPDSGRNYPRKKALDPTDGYVINAFKAAQNAGYTGTQAAWMALPAEDQWRKPYLESVRYGSDFRYYLFGRLGALTTEQEWFYQNGKLYLWAPGGGVPENVEYKARNYGFDLTGRSHIHLKSLNFFACEVITNTANSMWPSNASNWPEAQAAASAGGWAAGAPPWDRNNPAAVPTPANGILIDYCRFKYLNHYLTLPHPVEYPNQKAEILELRIIDVTLMNQTRFTTTGIRLTGDNCTVRNSVFEYAAGGALTITGRDALIQNNYFKDISYSGSWGSPITLCHYARGLRVLGNTAWRIGRGMIHGLGDNMEIGFNDCSNFTRNNIDGGGNYVHARWASPRSSDLNTRRYFMGDNLLGGRNPWVPINYNGRTVTEGNGAGAFKNVIWHHNWAHDSDDWHDQHPLGAGIYFDGDTDGVIIHHNVTWNNRRDLRAANSMGGSSFNFSNQPLGIHLIYNNTLGTPGAGVDGEVRSNLSTDARAQYANNASRWTMNNNIYRGNIGNYDHDTQPTSAGDLFIAQNTGAANRVFLAYDGARSSQPANGKPWLIGFGPGKHPSGLGFQLKAGSAAINKGVLLRTALQPNGQPIYDPMNRPLDYVDDPVNGPSPDAGAYEFGGPQVPGAPRYYDNPNHPAHGAWIPGTTLPREFIEGQPWERQWVTKRAS